MRIEADHNLIHDVILIEELRILVKSKYFGLLVTQEVLQQFYDDVNQILNSSIYEGNLYSELEVGFCPLRSKIWADFNTNSCGDTKTIYLEF